VKRTRIGLAEKNVLIFVVVRGLSLAVPLLTLPVLSRAINPSGFGMLALAQSIAMYLSSVIDYGFNLTAISSVVELRQEPLRLRALFWSIGACRALLLLACLAILALVCRVVGQTAEERQVIAMSSLLLVGVALTPSWLYQGLERGSSFAILSLAPRLAIFPLILLFVRRPENTPRAAAIAFGAELAAGLLLFTHAWTRLVPGPPKASRSIARAEATRAFDAWLGTVLTIFTANLNPLLLRHLIGLNAVGVFAAADRLVRVVFSFYYPVAYAYQASVTRSWKENDDAAGKAVIRKVMILFGTISVLFVLSVQIFGSRIVTVLFGGAFAGSVPILRVESLWLLFSGCSTVAIYFLYIARHQARALRYKYLVAAGVHCVALVAFVHYFAAVGAAIALVVSQALFAAILWSGAAKLRRSPGLQTAVS
jgi:O-antigen/teichoic acid export membrane protein